MSLPRKVKIVEVGPRDGQFIARHLGRKAASRAGNAIAAKRLASQPPGPV